jgi:hypothetical protein
MHVADFRHTIHVADFRHTIKIDFMHTIHVSELKHRIKVTETSLSAPSFQLHSDKYPFPCNKMHTITQYGTSAQHVCTKAVSLFYSHSVTSNLLLYWQIERITVGPFRGVSPVNKTRCGGKCSC